MNAAERVYVSSASDGETTSRLAEELARRIEDDIVSRDLAPGGALGSLRELAERYSVGRSVAREALGLLERRGLGKLRPGPCGGFIFARPQADTIGEQLADYFRATGVRLQQLLDAREAVDLTAARLAAASRIDRAHLARLEAAGAADDLSSALSARKEIARLAAQPVLLMFVECLNSLTLDFASAEPEAPVRERCARYGLDVARALRTGNAGSVVDATRHAHDALAARLVERESQAPAAVALTRAPAAGGTLAASIARTLAAEILTTGRAGTRLGSEWGLCERFNVSRLTLRQAVRLLQDGGLIDCRRGRGNGLVVRERRGPGAIRLMLAYLIGEKMDPMAAGTILFQINCNVPALAVARASARDRQALEAALSQVEACDPFDRLDLLGLVQCVSRVADSPIIDLFSRSLAAYEARFRPLTERLPASAQASYFRLVRRLLDRLPVGDTSALAWAKAESTALMVDMSLRRPL